jgi:hypothetical protein
MKSWHRAVAIVLLWLTFLVAVLLAMAWATLPLDGVTVTVHGQSFALAELQGVRAAVAFCIAVAVVVIAIVAALTMALVGLGFGVIGMVFGLLTAAASLALVLSPFALIGWLLWRALRERPAPVASTSR